MKQDVKPVKYSTGIFDQYKTNKNLDYWDNFPELMWGLGYEMDVMESYNKYGSSGVMVG